MKKIFFPSSLLKRLFVRSNEILFSSRVDRAISLAYISQTLFSLPKMGREDVDIFKSKTLRKTRTFFKIIKKFVMRLKFQFLFGLKFRFFFFALIHVSFLNLKRPIDTEETN